MKPAVRPLVDRVFRRRRDESALPAETELPLRGDTTVADLREFYGILLPESDESTLHDVLVARLGADALEVGARVHLGTVALVVRDLEEGNVEQAGLVIGRAPASVESAPPASPTTLPRPAAPRSAGRTRPRVSSRCGARPARP